MELEELKKSWNALDEHLKDKEFIKEEELEKLIKLSNNSRLALTNGIIYTPSGNKLAGIGVLPDICTSGEPETRDAEKIIARGSRSNACLPENRMKSELDLSVAEAYLRKHIK